MKSVKIFICYAREDEQLLKEFKKHLSLLRSSQELQDIDIKIWFDGSINPGADWNKEIKEQINTANIILLLVSASFFQSEYINKVELKTALERHERSEACVIPVIFRTCDWQETKIAELQALPRNGKAVVDSFWNTRDHAYTEVVKDIQLAIKDVASRKNKVQDVDSPIDSIPVKIRDPLPIPGSIPKLNHMRHTFYNIIPKLKDMTHIFYNISIVFGGLIISYTIASQRGIIPSSWNIAFGVVLMASAFIVGSLISRFLPDTKNLSRRKLTILYGIAVFLFLTLFLSSLFIPVSPLPHFKVYCSPVHNGQAIPPALIKGGIGVTEADDGEFIGISDGSFAFDTNTAPTGKKYVDLGDIQKKCQAAEQFVNNDAKGTTQSLNEALSQQPDDGEAHIYLENQNVLASKKSYVTVVVATTLTGKDPGKVGVGRSTLQGVFTAQYEHNHYNIEKNVADGLPKSIKVRVLIANVGSNQTHVNQVVQRIIQLAHADSTFIGVVGWNFSAYAAIEIPLLSAAHIPMILPTASKDKLLLPYSFRITPTSNKEAMIGARYVSTYVQARRILLFTDYDDDYSGNLANDFVNTYGRQNIVHIQTYRVGNPATLKGILDNLLVKYHPDLIYFAGYPGDLITLVENQLPQFGRYSTLKIMGGDALYEVSVQYPPNLYKRLFFTSAAFPDVWYRVNLPVPLFYTDYAKNFDPGNNHTGQYGWSRADADSILSYDALLALFNGYGNALQQYSHPSLQNVGQELKNVTFQGASGWVTLQDDDGTDPAVNKVIVMLTVDDNGYTQLQQIYGCLTSTVCYCLPTTTKCG